MSRVNDFLRHVHPMTYGFLITSIVWGVMVTMHVAFDSFHVLTDDPLMGFFPVNMIWAILLIAASSATTYLLVKNGCSRGNRRLWSSAVLCVMLWVFGAVVWVDVSAWAMAFVSLTSVLGFTYIAFASKFSKKYHRI